MKRARGVLLPELEGAAPAPSLRAGVYGRIRRAILAGRLRPGARLPSTRTLAAELGVSRTTAEDAYAQLVMEGYLARRVGDGSYVSSRLPGPARPPPRRPARSPPALSRRGHELSTAPACLDALVTVPFRAGHPDPSLFPLDVWQRLLARRLRRDGGALLGYGDPAGFRPLREALADHLATSRGVSCEPERIVILSSSQQALDLAARLLLDPGDAVWMEEPGYPGARAAFQLAGAWTIPVPVDERGLDVALGRRRAPSARLAYVTPSHQYPLGPALALERRLELLAWAREAGAWILEDDYDAELRYGGRPIAAVQGLDPDARVVHVGTFTKLVFPSLRLAWAVLPGPLVEPFVHARRLQDGHPPTLAQAVAADFLAEGHLATWLRRLRAACAERRDALRRHASASRPAHACEPPARSGGTRSWPRSRGTFPRRSPRPRRACTSPSPCPGSTTSRSTGGPSPSGWTRRPSRRSGPLPATRGSCSGSPRSRRPRSGRACGRSRGPCRRSGAERRREPRRSAD